MPNPPDFIDVRDIEPRDRKKKVEQAIDLYMPYEKRRKNDYPDEIRVLLFDTETTGLPNNGKKGKYRTEPEESNYWPHICQIAYVELGITGKKFKKYGESDLLICPQYPEERLTKEALEVHGHTYEKMITEGLPRAEVLTRFNDVINRADLLVAHNMGFDLPVTGSEYLREFGSLHSTRATLCTKEALTDVCKIEKTGKAAYYPGYKWPSLEESYEWLRENHFPKVKPFSEFDAHNAFGDTSALSNIFVMAIRAGYIDLHQTLTDYEQEKSKPTQAN